jgi:hypothetical protein
MLPDHSKLKSLRCRRTGERVKTERHKRRRSAFVSGVIRISAAVDKRFDAQNVCRTAHCLVEEVPAHQRNRRRSARQVRSRKKTAMQRLSCCYVTIRGNWRRNASHSRRSASFRATSVRRAATSPESFGTSERAHSPPPAAHPIRSNTSERIRPADCTASAEWEQRGVRGQRQYRARSIGIHSSLYQPEVNTAFGIAEIARICGL